MKLFKKSVSIFLAILMIFGSVSLMATAAEADYNWEIDTKFYRYDGSEWVETTKAAKGEAVKARVFVKTDFNFANSSFFFFYPTTFLSHDVSAYNEGEYEGAYDIRMNPNPESESYQLNYGGNMETGTDISGMFENQVSEGILDASDIEGIGWVLANLKYGDASTVLSGEHWIFEFDFNVVEEPQGDGQFYLSSECIADPSDEKYMGATVIGIMKSGTKWSGRNYLASCDADFDQVAFTLNDTDADSSLSCDNTVTFTAGAKVAEYTGYIGDPLSSIEGFSLPTASAEGKQFLGWSLDGATVIPDDEVKAMAVGYEPIELKAVFQAAEASYTVNVYEMDINGAYPEAATKTEVVGSKPGTVVSASSYSAPAGFSVDLAASSEDKEVTAEGTTVLDVYLARNKYTATFGDTVVEAYYGAEYDVPAGADTDTGVFEYWVNAADESAILYAETKATMGLENATYVAKYNPLYEVTYEFAGTEPEEYEVPAASKVTAGTIIAKPAVTVPAGYNLVWTANGATANEDGTFTAGANDVKITGTWAKIPYTVTYVYADNGNIPSGYTAPAATTLTIGETITAPAVEIPAGYKLDWEREGDVMGAANVTMTGTWSKIPYTVTYAFSSEAPDGVSAPNAETVTIGDVIDLPELEAEGWTFNGWKVTGAVETDGVYTVGASNVTVTGSWIKNTYVINYWLDDNMTELYADATYSYGESVERPEDPTDDYFEPGTTFVGWDQDFEVIDEDTLSIAGLFTETEPGVFECNLVASVSPIEYTVTVKYINVKGYIDDPATEDDESIVLESSGFYYGDEFEYSEIEGYEYVEGYDFDKWCITGTTPATFPIIITGDTTIRGYFNIQKYNAVFDAAGGAWLNGDTERVIEFEYGEEITAPVDDPVKEGYHLNPEMKWDQELGTMLDYDQYFEANWEPNTYTLTFVVEGETVEVDHKFGEKIDAPAAPDKAGYDFVGWTTDGGNTIITDISGVDVPAADTTYTAFYVPSAGGVNYKVNRYFMNTDGTYEGVTADTVVLHEVAETVVTYNAEIEGFTLDTTAGKLTDTVNGNGSTVLEAYYTRNKYAAEFVANGKVVSTDVYYGAAIEAPASADAEAGYKFIGWSKSESATTPDADLGTMTTAGAKFYAVYEAIDVNYTVEIYLMDKDGNYGAATVETKTGTTGEIGTADHAEFDQEAFYLADDAAANETSKVIAGDGSTVLKLYNKAVELGLTENVAIDALYTTLDRAETAQIIYNMEKKPAVSGASIFADVTADGILFSATFTAPEASTTTKVGYELASWNGTYAPGEVITVTGALDLVAVNEAMGVPFNVELYLMDANGNYPTTASITLTENGETDFVVEISHGNYTQYITDKYYLADTDHPENYYSEAIKGDGSTVLKLYYKRAAYEVTVDGAVAEEVIHGATYTTPATAAAKEGHSLTGWTDGTNTYGLEEAIVVTAPVALTAVYAPNNYTVTFEADGATVATGDYAYGTVISTILPAYTAPAGYVFAGWSLDGVTVIDFTDDVTVPVDGIKYVAVNNAVESAYTVETRVMNEAGDDYVVTSETKYALTETVINYTAEDKTGFTVNLAESVLTGEVTGDGLMKIVVVYDRDKYEITVNGVTDEYYYGEEIPAPVAPEKEGYTFDKWENVTTGEEVTFPYVVSADDDNIAIVPKYTVNNYTVTFKVRGTVYATGEYAYGTAIVNPGDPSVPGYTFNGWSKTGAIVDLATETVPASNVTYTAVLTANTDTAYNVKKFFRSTDGHTWVEATEVRYGTTGETVTIDADNEAVEGFTISEIIPESATIAGNGSTTFEIYYERDLVEITINGDKDEYFYGEEIAAPSEPTKDGYTFTGWVDADGNAVTFPIEATVDGLVINPVFEANTVSLSFVVGDDVVEGYPINVKVDSAITAPEAPKMEGYNFVNWYIQGTNIAFNGKMPTTDTVYEAKFTEGTNIPVAIEIYTMNTAGVYEKTVTYTLGVTGSTIWIEPSTDLPGLTPNYEKSKLSDVVAANGSTVLSIYYDRDLYTVTWNVDGVKTTEDVYYGAAIVAPEAPTKTGYTFAGWDNEVPATMPENNLEFTAQWDAAMYNVTYVENGKTTTETYAYGATVTVKDADAVEGMTFVGWFADGVEYVAGSTFTMPANDIIIVADFAVSVYKVTFLNADGGIFSTEMVKCGDKIPVPDAEPTKENHVFVGWNMIYDVMPEMNITIEPIFERVPVKLIAKEGTKTVIDRDINVITGLGLYLSSQADLDEYLDVEGDGYYVATPVAAMKYGTGTVIDLYDNADTSKPIETYVIVVYGDLDGDGAIESIDSTIVDDEGLSLTTWSLDLIPDSETRALVANPDYNPYKVMAADINHDGIVDVIDADIIGDSVLGIYRINQVTGYVY